MTIMIFLEGVIDFPTNVNKTIMSSLLQPVL